jgi:hypothetical protein
MRLQHRAGRRSGRGRGTRPGTERTASASAQAASPRARALGGGVLKDGAAGLALQLLRPAHGLPCPGPAVHPVDARGGQTGW